MSPSRIVLLSVVGLLTMQPNMLLGSLLVLAFLSFHSKDVNPSWYFDFRLDFGCNYWWRVSLLGLLWISFKKKKKLTFILFLNSMGFLLFGRFRRLLRFSEFFWRQRCDLSLSLSIWGKVVTGNYERWNHRGIAFILMKILRSSGEIPFFTLNFLRILQAVMEHLTQTLRQCFINSWQYNLWGEIYSVVNFRTWIAFLFLKYEWAVMVGIRYERKGEC